MKSIILSFYHPDLVKGGGQQVAINLHRALVKKGVDSTFIGCDNNVPHVLRSDATPVTKLPGRKNEYVCQVGAFNSMFMVSADPWSSKGLFNLIVQSEPDVIYVHHFLMVGVDLIDYLRLALKNTKFVFTAHEFLSVCMRDGHVVLPDGSLCASHTPTDCIKCFPSVPTNTFVVRNEIFSKFYRCFDIVVTPSKFMHDNLISVHPEIKSKLRCIPNGSYYQSEIKKFISIKKVHGTTKSVGFFGQMLADKGISELLAAFEQLKTVSVRVKADFWGSNFNLNPEDFRSRFMEKFNKVKDGDEGLELRLMGEFKNSQAIDLMRNYDIIVFPSKWPETFSLVLSEALLAGAIVIVPNIGAFKERAKNHKDRVITYDFGNKTGIADAIKLALSRKLQSSEITISEDLSIEMMADRYLEIVSNK